MIYNFLRYLPTPMGRRLFALFTLLMLPVLLTIAFVSGTILHLWDFVRNYVRDLKDLVMIEIRGFIADFIFVIRTGNL